MRFLYKMLSLFALFGAAKKGPGGLAKYGARRAAHRATSKTLRKFKL
ncbi:MAG: hypothetical protein OXB95_08950 [Rhodobacteraceae bacterium]|nr:hypothetical protein [Paracoccaceae bacterium]